MIRIAVAEDNPFLAKSIEEKIGLFPNKLKLKFIGTDGKDLLDRIEKDTNIDVVLMDIQMPFMDGISCTKVLHAKFPQIKIIILTVFDDEESLFNAILAGANGYLLKDENPQVILESIEDILAGGAPMSSAMALKALKLLRQPINAAEPTSDESYELSSREIDVLTQLSKGLQYKQIADNLHIAPATVRKHIENIYQKLKVHNKIEAVELAKRNRLI